MSRYNPVLIYPYKTCTELRMRANDEASATTNRIILINALNAGTKVLVDDKYYLQSDSLTYGTLGTKDIYI